MDIFRKGDALIVADVQNDFLPGGSLEVAHADEIVPLLNRYVRAAKRKMLPIFAIRDWHPANHCSFRSQGGSWPPHCVAGSAGAAFAPTLELPSSVDVISKGSELHRDAYSGFQGTDLEARLRARGVDRIFVGGLATDYCVLETVKDATARGFEVGVLTDAIRAVDVQQGDGARAEREMARLGAHPVRLDMVEDADAARIPAH
jgi:nicotinamidase/pyrazinamidase